MPRFSYTAYDHLGARTAGEISADTRELALEALSRQGRFPLELVEGGAVRRTALVGARGFRARPAVAPQPRPATRELATLVKAELPVDEALRIVSLQPLMPARARGVVASVLAACSMAPRCRRPCRPRSRPCPSSTGASSMPARPAARSARRSTSWPPSWSARPSSAPRSASALVYPVTLLIAAGAALAIILMILVPTIAPMFKDAGRDPPAVIQVLIGIAGAHRRALAAGADCARCPGHRLPSPSRATSAGALPRDRAFMRVPLLSGLIENGETATLARTLGTMLKNGVPLLQALEVTGNSLSNRAVARRCTPAPRRCSEGGTLVGSLCGPACSPSCRCG